MELLRKLLNGWDPSCIRQSATVHFPSVYINARRHLLVQLLMVSNDLK